MSGQSRPREQRAAELLYYFDADVLGLAKIIASLRSDATYPGDPGGTVHGRTRPACVVTTPETPDEVWIPTVTNQGLVIITRDSRIERRPGERQTIVDHGARLFALTGAHPLNKWAQLEILMSRWRDIDQLRAIPGPTIFAVTYSGIRRLI